MLLFGNFNEILSNDEKEGGCARQDREMMAFRGCLDDCGLRDLGFSGSTFTWCRGNTPTTMIRERLDRFVACSGWQNRFPSFDVRHFPIYRSDHAPILLHTSRPPGEGCNAKLFCFESLWLSNDECRGVVTNAWRESLGEEMDFRIANCAEKLSSWAECTFGALRSRIKSSERKLRAAQRCPLMQIC